MSVQKFFFSSTMDFLSFFVCPFLMALAKQGLKAFLFHENKNICVTKRDFIQLEWKIKGATDCNGFLGDNGVFFCWGFSTIFFVRYSFYLKIYVYYNLILCSGLTFDGNLILFISESLLILFFLLCTIFL